MDTPDVASLKSDIAHAMAQTHGTLCFVLDAELGVLRQDIADSYVELARGDNPRIERTAFLVGQAATFGLQIERMIRDAGNPSRRSFHDRRELSKWLAELLPEPERRQLEVFLDSAVSS